MPCADLSFLIQAADVEFKSEYNKAAQQWKADDEYEMGMSLNPIESRRAVFLGQQEASEGCRNEGGRSPPNADMAFATSHRVGLTITYTHLPSLAQAWKLRGEDFRRQVEDDARLQMAGLTARVKVRVGWQSLRLPITPSVGLKTLSLS